MTIEIKVVEPKAENMTTAFGVTGQDVTALVFEIAAYGTTMTKLSDLWPFIQGKLNEGDPATAMFVTKAISAYMDSLVRGMMEEVRPKKSEKSRIYQFVDGVGRA